MLTDSQRTALTQRLRRGRTQNGSSDPFGLKRRDPGLADLPLSFAQEQLWFLDRFAPGEAMYNIPIAISLDGALDTRALQGALEALAGRHETLRTRLVTSNGRPIQCVDPPHRLGAPMIPIANVDLSAEPSDSRLREFIDTEALRPFDLAAGPLMRVSLIRLGTLRHVLLAIFHHVVFDGWSATVLLRELASLYRQCASGEPSGLTELPVQFADYAIWERARLDGAQPPDSRRGDSARYWREIMDGFETVRFPADRPRPLVEDWAGGLAVRMTDPDLLAGLRELSRRQETTLFVTLMAGLQALLHRYTGQTDLVVGTVTANRARPELASLIGFCVNTLPIRTDSGGDPSFTELIGRVRQATTGAYAHQDLPFGKIVETLAVPRDPGRAPVFQIMLAYAERDLAQVEAAGVRFTLTDLVAGIRSAKFDLSFVAEARPGGLWFECSYKTALFDEGRITRLLGHLEVLLRGAVANPAARLSELPLLTDAELRAELRDWNDTTGPVPPSCVHEGFEAQAARTPDAVAAEFEDERVSYAELNRQANQVARRLRDLGVGPETLAGVSMPAGLRRLAALLGILKAGGGYVPLDPALPADRLAFMINDTGMRVVLTDDRSRASVPEVAGVTVVCLDAEWDRLRQLPGGNLAGLGVTPANIAYVIYTSGSTGQPKGVVVEHRSVVNLVHGRMEHWGIGAGNAVLQFASYAFDMSVLDTFLSLLSGARMVLPAPETWHSPPRLAELIRQARVTYANLPTAVLDLLPAGHYPDLRVLSVGGEQVPAELARRWIRPGLALVNGYGPTEATSIAVIADLDAATSMPPPIGFPVRPNYRAYVLDQRLNPVPVGVYGELHIGGAGLARGYLNRPGLTSDRFIPDPFSSGQRLHKTGDLVRRRPDGCLEFAGRIDNQVKIRGIRIELGEIEEALLAHPAIAQAVVTVVTGTAGDLELVAYLRLDSEPGTDQDISAHLARTLPAAMIPTHYIVVETFPLNSSSKVDRSALPAVVPQPPAAEHVVPVTILEILLADIYSALLGVIRVGATDSFFDLGGNSLQAMRLIGELHQELGVEVGPASVFVAPTPRQLAGLLRDEHGFSDGEPAKGDATGRIGRRSASLATPTASFGQEQLWFLDQFAPGQATYNVPSVVRIRGMLDPSALERAFGGLIRRHEVLRTRLVADAPGRPVQVIDPVGPVVLDGLDLAGPGGGLAGLAEFVLAEAVRPFDLAAGPLLRARLVRLGETEHALVAVFHHAVFDGWSAGVFVRDLAALYRGEVTGEEPGIGELAVQFADYAVWERQRLRGRFLADLESYWRGVLDGFETVQFPADRRRPVVDRFDGALAERMTDAALLAGLREVSRREGVTLFVTLMAGLLALLRRYTGQDDLVVGTVSANRGRAELASLIGFLVNTLPIRCDVSGDPSFGDLLARVKEVVVGAFAHQELPFGQLVDAVKVERDASRSPVFQINFTYAERDDTLVHAAGADFLIVDLVRGIDAAKFDLTFAVETRAEGLWLECCYKTALFDAGTIERLLGHFEVLLRGVVASPAARLSELPLLTDAELQAELRDWNDTAGPVPPICVHEGFEAQAARTPDAVAAEFEDERVCYAELNRQANQVARRLRDLGVGPEALAGVCMATGLRRLAVLLGILKAGGGYVPLDPALPAQRLAFMINDTAMTVILTDDASAGRVPATGALNVDAEWDRLRQLPGGNLAGLGVTPANIAYVIYTSGSTGQPKGVVVEHRNVVNLAYALIEHWGIGPGSVMLAFASFAFDVSVKDMFLSLLSGTRLVLAAPETLHSPPRLAELIRQTGVTFASLPPAVLGLLPAGQYPELRVIIAGGDELPAEVARRWMRPGLALANGYGPTETTVTAAFAELDASTPMPPPIGFPVRPNYRVYVLDSYLNPVPVGVIGELHIGGAGVTRGYLNRPDLTAERFIADPFVPGQRLYKSGDLVRRRPDGTLEFAGRIDNQVKIRGLRMELGEIETALVTHPDVAQAVVTVVTGPAGDPELAAYLRRPDSTSVRQPDIRAHLARTLPAAMIPAHYVTVETFPLNSNGKVDRKALPIPRREVTQDKAEPETPIEAMLTGLYATLLGSTSVGATDSFFDLGGNSLTAMRLVDLISRETDVDIGVSTVFLHPTPRRLAAALSRSGSLPGSGPLVTLNSGKAESPLFLVHPIGGTVSAYAPLGQELADTFKAYGLESPALSDGGVVASSLTDLVTDYTQRIRAFQRTGPYALAGWSMGGVIAFEIAQRLEQDGADVSLLVLLDAPFAILADPSGEAELAARFVADAARSLSLDPAGAPDPATVTPAGQLAWLAERLDGSDPAERDAIEARLQRRFGLFAAHSRMLAGYRPAGKPVRAATLIISAANSLNTSARTLWPGQLTGEVSVLSVDSDHYEFLRPPLVGDIGAAISRVAVSRGW